MLMASRSGLQESTYFHPHVHTAWQHVVSDLLSRSEGDAKSEDASSADKLPSWTKLWKEVVEGIAFTSHAIAAFI